MSIACFSPTHAVPNMCCKLHELHPIRNAAIRPNQKTSLSEAFSVSNAARSNPVNASRVLDVCLKYCQTFKKRLLDQKCLLGNVKT